MGQVKDTAADVYRDFEVAGVPASGANDPAKPDIRALFSFIDLAIGAAQAGITIVSTTADRDTFYATEANRGKLVYVNNNNGSATDPANGVYEYVAGAPRIAQSFYDGIATVVQPLVDEAEAYLNHLRDSVIVVSSGKNQFNKDGLIAGKEISLETGQLVTPPAPENSAVSNLMFVRGWEAATISGLPGNPNDPFYAWLAADNKTVLSFGFWDKALSTVTLEPPAAIRGKVNSLLIDVYRRDDTPGSLAAVQVEQGYRATAYEAFNGDSEAGIDNHATAVTRPYAGDVAFLFGDSITQTENSAGGQYIGGAGVRPNWPDVAMPLIDPAVFYNFALGGAHFSSDPAAGLSGLQMFEKQVDAAVALGITPRWLLVGLGTNDFNSSKEPGLEIDLGDFTTAMAKPLSFGGNGTPTTTLDGSVSIEAARLQFARLRFYFPHTVMFCSLPIQRAQYTIPQMQPWIDTIAWMAHAYGFEVIDCFGESGIVRDFEIVGSSGTNLVDGLHPNNYGIAKMGKFIAARVMARLSA